MNRRFAARILVLLILLIVSSGCMATAGMGPDRALTPRQFKLMLDDHQDGTDMVLLDVRTSREFNDGRIRGALLLDFYASDFVDRLKTLDRDKTYLVYCRSGNRSAKTLAIMQRLNFPRVYHMATGIKGWLKEAYALVK